MEDKNSHNQTKRFTTVLTEEVMNFVQKQENKAREKISGNSERYGKGRITGYWHSGTNMKK